MWCYIALDGNTELKSTAVSSDKEKTYMLSDGNTTTFSAECFRCVSAVQLNVKQGDNLTTGYLSRKAEPPQVSSNGATSRQAAPVKAG